MRKKHQLFKQFKHKIIMGQLFLLVAVSVIAYYSVIEFKNNLKK